jgi:hypothetical protein
MKQSKAKLEKYFFSPVLLGFEGGVLKGNVDSFGVVFVVSICCCNALYCKLSRFASLSHNKHQ